MRTFIAVQLEDERNARVHRSARLTRATTIVSAWMRHRLGLHRVSGAAWQGAAEHSRRMTQPPLFPEELAKADETAALRAQLAAIAARLELLEQGGEQKKSA